MAERHLLGKKESFLGRKMNPGYIVISLGSLIKQDDVSICLPASRRTGIYEEGAWHRVLTSVYSATEKHSCIKLDLQGEALISSSLTEVGHSCSVPGGANDILRGISKRLRGWKDSPGKESC